MTTKTTITEITHDDLVNLFSTALYGSNYLSADYEEAIEYNERDCFEDTIAKILLHNGCVKVSDHYSEVDIYGNLPHELDEERGCTTYYVTLEDIKRGLENAANGTFNINIEMGEDFAKGNVDFARTSFDFLLNDDTRFDLWNADCLMQIIIFNEIIYG